MYKNEFNSTSDRRKAHFQRKLIQKWQDRHLFLIFKIDAILTHVRAHTHAHRRRKSLNDSAVFTKWDFNVRNAMTRRQSVYDGIVSPLWVIFRRFFHRLKATILLGLEVSWGNVTFPRTGLRSSFSQQPRRESGLWQNAAGFSHHCEC